MVAILPVPRRSGIRRVLAAAAAIESRSEHPIGRAVVARAADEGLTIGSGVHHHALHGRGAEGEVDGTHVLVGSRRLFEERGVPVAELAAACDAAEQRGHSIVLVAVDGRAIGALAIADRVRNGAADAVAGLRRQGIAHVALLTRRSRSGGASRSPLLWRSMTSGPRCCRKTR